MTDASPSDLDALLVEHLRTHEDRCPRCDYVLRGLERATCPECGDALRLELASPDVSDVDWVWAMSGFLGASGFFIVAVIAAATNRLLGGSGLPGVRMIAVLGAAFLGAAVTVGLLRRRFRRLRHRRAVGRVLFTAGLVLGLLSLFLVD